MLVNVLGCRQQTHLMSRLSTTFLRIHWRNKSNRLQDECQDHFPVPGHAPSNPRHAQEGTSVSVAILPHRQSQKTRWLYSSSISAPVRELPKDSCFQNSWFQRHAASSYLSLKTVFHECHPIVEPNSHIHDLVLGEAVKSKYCSLCFGKMSCTL